MERLRWASSMRLFDSADDEQGLVRIFVTSLKNEGPGFLMKGWTPAWLRLA
jgi:dicarboxylate transporter 10